MTIRIPEHIGIIPDGNRRWAKGAGLSKQEGYFHGLEPGLALLRLGAKSGIKEMTFYGFTSDNTHRPKEQLEAFSKACVDAVRLMEGEAISLLVLGNTDSKCFPEELLPYTTRTDCHGGGMRVNLLVNYGWEWDLSELSFPGISRSGIVRGLKSHDISRIDLIIRWGGMRRLSGFLPVQSVYADFFVAENLWPDFKPKDFDDALSWYDRQDVTRGG